MRAPAVAGYFYPENRDELDRMVSAFLNRASSSSKPVRALGGICPHAGYVYSGQTAASTYSSISNLKDAKTIVILGPNHTGAGTPVSISKEDWETPLGISRCDSALAEKIKKASKTANFDERAHAREHSVEVQLPFVQKISPEAKLVAICMMDQGYETSCGIGAALASALDPERHVVIASSDFSHYVPASEAKKMDGSALALVEALDSKGFQSGREKNNWSVCGYGPITALMEYAKARGVKKGKVMQYTNSGAASGDFLAVVGYASVIFPTGVRK